VHRTELQHTTHQTARLARGKHASPGDGVCVMELASMLGREPFTDSPECASPIVAAFLRAYNDAVDDDARQDLYDYASKVVGTHAAAAVERRRAERCLEVLHGLRGGGLLEPGGPRAAALRRQRTRPRAR
jgi:hypothetical protein